MADDRAQKCQVELKHTVDVLHEEQERVVKIESIKKALEIEIKNLTIRLEEVETNAMVTSKRIITKLEARVKPTKSNFKQVCVNLSGISGVVGTRYGTGTRRGASPSRRDHKGPAQEGTHHQGSYDPRRRRPQERYSAAGFGRETDPETQLLQTPTAGTGL